MLAQALVNLRGQAPFALNFGPHSEDALPVETIVKNLVLNWGHDAGWESQPGEHPHEALTLKLDIALSGHRLGWSPSLKISRALELCCEWHRRYVSGESPRKVTFDQVSSYLSDFKRI